MKLYRTQEIKTNKFEVGDVIAFTLTDGEEVEAMAVKQEQDGMIFCLVDCLNQEYTMNEEDSNRGGYEATDLRVKLNGEILERFPADIREKMVAFANGDYLRLPAEKEIFGCNNCGKAEPDDVQQWEPMKQRKNRIALRGKGTDRWEWYWLQNAHKRYATDFALVDVSGDASYSGASDTSGVRPVFKLKMDSEVV